MIVKSDADGFVGIPTDGISEAIDLAPGYNDIPNEKWAAGRKNARRLIENGSIVEEWVKVPADDVEKAGKKDGEIEYIGFPKELVLKSDDGKETTKRLVPATLADIDRKGNKVINIVKGTFHIPTLKKWYENELRADVRVELQKQIAGVESGDIKG